MNQEERLKKALECEEDLDKPCEVYPDCDHGEVLGKAYRKEKMLRESAERILNLLRSAGDIKTELILEAHDKLVKELEEG